MFVFYFSVRMAEWSENTHLASTYFHERSTPRAEAFSFFRRVFQSSGGMFCLPSSRRGLSATLRSNEAQEETTVGCILSLRHRIFLMLQYWPHVLAKVPNSWDEGIPESLPCIYSFPMRRGSWSLACSFIGKPQTPWVYLPSMDWTGLVSLGSISFRRRYE